MGQATTGQHYLKERKAAQDDYDSRKREPLMDMEIREDPVNKLLFCQNLVEMIPFAPLVDSLMDQQITKSFRHNASLVHTPVSSLESWLFKKAVDHSNKGKPGRGQLVPSKRGDLRELSLWDNAENMLHDDHNLYTEEIPLLPYPSNQRATRVAPPPSSDTIQLRRQVQQLEQKLSEKECQLQTAEKTAQQIHMQLNATIERLQSQIQQKDQAIQNIQNQLFERKLEVVSLQSLVKQSEVNAQASSMKAASLEEELSGLRSQVGALLFLVQSQISGEESPTTEEVVIEEQISSATWNMPLMGDMQVDEIGSPEIDGATKVMQGGMQVDEIDSPEIDGAEEEHIEEIRKNYVAALIDARDNSSDEKLSLVTELRMQLHELVMCTTITTSAMNDERCWQTLGIPTC